ncbi:MarC family protein, partial [Pseudonocardia ailaonensis]|uniref:MarC family protein n=1 Tax=Pseudonocardia ailaonensis TaxID=367279 RepID=UPI0031DBD134
FEQPLLLFLALFALYSPVAALSSYFPVVSRLGSRDQLRLAIALFGNVAIFGLVALWVGEPLLELLGISTAALTAVGGIALLYEGIPLMRGVAAHPPEPSEEPAGTGAGETSVDAPTQTGTWRKYAFVPVTFPLTVGGTTFAFFVGFRAEATSVVDVVALSVAGVLYAAVTGATLYASAHVQRRAKPSTQAFLERIAGILLTAIAVMILTSGATRMVVDVLDGLNR